MTGAWMGDERCISRSDRKRRVEESLHSVRCPARISRAEDRRRPSVLRSHAGDRSRWYAYGTQRASAG